MKAPKGLIISPVGTNDAGDLVLNVRLRRRSWYAFRLLYQTAREKGIGRAMAFRLSVRLVLARSVPEEDER